MGYAEAIKTAILIFPLIAFLFTLPFILHQYHKYGAIHKFRTLIIYSFILYMITIYFLVILPLPSISDVTKPDKIMNLIPFSFVDDFINKSSFIINDPSTYLTALSSSAFYVAAFNILMTIPFGMYLRYYFKFSFKKVFFFSFCLSLFFELTQLSGLYFIYPYPYRLFDVDDLILNTLGGVLGYFIMGIVDNFLPTRDEIDKQAKELGKTVSGLRRITLFFLDMFIFVIFTIFVSIFTKKAIYISFVIYYVLIPYFKNNQTLGGKFLNVKLEFPNKKLIRLTLRIIFIYVYYFILVYFLGIGSIATISYLNLNTFISFILYVLVLLGIFTFYLTNIIIILKEKTIFYDKLFKVTYESTILIEEEINDESEGDENEKREDI